MQKVTEKKKPSIDEILAKAEVKKEKRKVPEAPESFRGVSEIVSLKTQLCKKYGFYLLW